LGQAGDRAWESCSRASGLKSIRFISMMHLLPTRASAKLIEPWIAGAKLIMSEGIRTKGDDGTDSSVASWTQMDPDSKRPVLVSSLDCWRPRRDLNPCYRRESKTISGK
jgi:hypothetical protein